MMMNVDFKNRTESGEEKQAFGVIFLRKSISLCNPLLGCIEVYFEPSVLELKNKVA